MEMNKHRESNSNAGRCHARSLYSQHEAEALKERLTNKETYREAQQVLVSWLEDGQCNESNSSQFYALIQLCRNNMDELQKKQEEYSEEAKEIQKNLRNRSCCIQLQLNEIEDVFKAIEKKDILDKFTESQIKEIHEMRKDILDLKQNCSLCIVADEEDPPKRCKECQDVILKLQLELKKRKKTNQVNVDEMEIISLVSCFLYDNPDGVNIVSIYSHLNKCIPVTSTQELEEIMKKYPAIFKETSPIEGTEEKKWTCISINQETMALLNE